jgi:hypothetical protein
MKVSDPIFAFTDHTSNWCFDIKKWPSESLFLKRCPYCGTSCSLVRDNTFRLFARLAFCVRCGWWSYEYYDDGPDFEELTARGILKEFSVDDMDVPIKELASYLTNNHDRLLDIHPKKFEELVASVYKDVFGSVIEYISYCRPDRGIDIVCLNLDHNRTVAIQVKRYRHPIQLGQIHQFFGALVDNDYKEGVFVTTSRFQKGGLDVQQSLNEKTDIHIDLVDGQRFLEFLNLLNRHKADALLDEIRVFCDRIRKGEQNIKLLQSV